MTAVTTGPDTFARLQGEGLISIPAAADHLGDLLGLRPHEATLRGWARRGYHRRDGRSVVLETCSFGKRIFTSRAACERFVRATQRDGATLVAIDQPDRSHFAPVVLLLSEVSL